MNTAQARRSRFTLSVLVWLFSMVSPAWAAITASLEGPEEAQQVAGIGIIRGWAFSDGAGVTIAQVKLLVDGSSFTDIPCCSPRSDVAQAIRRVLVPMHLTVGLASPQTMAIFHLGLMRSASRFAIVVAPHKQSSMP